MDVFLHLLLVLNTITFGLFAFGLFLVLWQTEDEQSHHEREIRRAEARLSEINQQAQAAILAEMMRQTRQRPGSFGGGAPPAR